MTILAFKKLIYVFYSFKTLVVTKVCVKKKYLSGT